MSTTITLELDDDAIATVRRWETTRTIPTSFVNGILRSILDVLPAPPLEFGDRVLLRLDPDFEVPARFICGTGARAWVIADEPGGNGPWGVHLDDLRRAP